MLVLLSGLKEYFHLVVNKNPARIVMSKKSHHKFKVIIKREMLKDQINVTDSEMEIDTSRRIKYRLLPGSDLTQSRLGKYQRYGKTKT